MMANEPLRLVSARVTEVLGEYTHEFKFHGEGDFVILYGPNGVGKTKFLEIIYNLATLEAERLVWLPFKEATLHYSDGSELVAVRQSMQSDLEASPEDEQPSAVHITLRNNDEHILWDYDDSEYFEFIQSRYGYSRLTETLWHDPSDGEITHDSSLRNRFERSPWGRRLKNQTPPEELAVFAKRAPAYLIETQRLRVEREEAAGSRFRPPNSRDERWFRSRISEQAAKLRALLNSAQTRHSRITQDLDRTFPNRVLSAARSAPSIDPEEVRVRYDSQNDFRGRLARITSAPLGGELALPERILEDWELVLLNQYLDDADRKLEPFELLLTKVELLERIINERLLNKTLKVSDQEGMIVKHAKSARTIPLESLSSGEQHVIILMVDLLFNVEPGATVLIDEPEISLHVAWQVAFMSDVQKIASISHFRFVVATHSPQIVGPDWDKTKRLGPSEGDL